MYNQPAPSLDFTHPFLPLHPFCYLPTFPASTILYFSFHTFLLPITLPLHLFSPLFKFLRFHQFCHLLSTFHHVSLIFFHPLHFFLISPPLLSTILRLLLITSPAPHTFLGSFFGFLGFTGFW